MTSILMKDPLIYREYIGRLYAINLFVIIGFAIVMSVFAMLIQNFYYKDYIKHMKSEHLSGFMISVFIYLFVLILIICFFSSKTIYFQQKPHQDTLDILGSMINLSPSQNILNLGDFHFVFQNSILQSFDYYYKYNVQKFSMSDIQNNNIKNTNLHFKTENQTLIISNGIIVFIFENNQLIKIVYKNIEYSLII